MNFLKDSISTLLEDKKMIDDINWLRKKVELLSSSMSAMRTLEDDKNNSNTNLNNTNNKQINFDPNKYVDNLVFLDFQKYLVKEIDSLKRFAEENKRYINDLIEAGKSKADEKDIKNLEEFLNSKTEEMKLGFTKKFADKTDTMKNIKYLDTQIKHIIDSFVKKQEKGDNWLLAKKPVGGYTCASCESYIGKLQDSSTQHLNWNKYPQRDQNDKAYRVFFYLLLLFLFEFNKINLDQINYKYKISFLSIFVIF